MRALPLSLVLVLACVAPVRADAVPPPPDDCPPGSTGVTGHGGIWCEASTCWVDAQCGAGRVCREAPLCVREVEATFNTATERPARQMFRIAIRECGGGPSECPPDAPAHIGWDVGGRDITDATSDGDYRALGPARCLTEMRCVPLSDPSAAPRRAPAGARGERAGTERHEAAPSTTTPARSSGCAVGAESSGAASAGLVVALAMLGAARRRRRS